MPKRLLKLFILGYTPVAKRAIKNLAELGKIADIKALYNIEVINLYEHPEYTEKEKVLATPLLLVTPPPPQLRIIGDLSNADRVLEALTTGIMNHENQ